MIEAKSIGAPKRRRGVKSGGWFFIGIVILAISWWLNQRYGRTSASAQLGGHTNGFYGKNIKDIYAAPFKGEYRESVPLPQVFNLKVPETQNTIRVVYRYRCVTLCSSLWMSFPSTESKTPIRLLLQHDVLKKFRFPSVTDRGITLFQKQVIYHSIDEFMNNPPTSGLVYSDTNFLQGSFDLEKTPDFIVTSYQRPRLFPDGWIEFAQNFDTDGVARSNGYIQMSIFSGSESVKIDLTTPTVELIE
jgi:hypothetical protein